MRVLVGVVVGLEQRDVVVAGRAGRRGTAGPGGGTPRPGARPRTRARRRRCRSCARSRRRRAGTRPTIRCAARRRPRARARPTSTCCPPRGVSRSACTSSRTASSSPSPNQRSSSGESGSSCAAHATCARSTNGFCGLTTARSGARPVSSAGCAAYHWSSWSSPATSTAAARRPVRPARPGLLPHRRERAGEAVEHDRVEAADVDAELERVRGRDAEQPAARELELERAPLRRGGSRHGTRRHGRAEPGLEPLEAPARVLRDDLGAAPAPRERERLVAGAHEARRAARRSRRWPSRARRSARRAAGVASTRARARNAASRRRRSARPARPHSSLASSPGLPIVALGEAERRVGAVVLAQSSQPAQHVRDVAAEDAAQRVQLVDDDVAQPHEERGPALVRRQDPHVQHLGVGEHDVGVLAGPRAVVAGGVAVVGDRAQPGHEPRAQRRGADRGRAPWWGRGAVRCRGGPSTTDSTIGTW